MASSTLTAHRYSNGARAWLNLFHRTLKSWVDDFAPSMGAALSYYTVFSIAPLLLIVIRVVGVFFGPNTAHDEIFGEIASLLGSPAADSLESLVRSAGEARHGGWATAIGVVGILVGATTVLAELQSALDRIWRTPAKKAAGLWGFLRTRLLTFSMILGLVFLLMVSLLLSAGLTAVGRFGTVNFERWGAVLQIANLVVGFGVTALLFAMIYKLLPRERIAWRDVWVGALVTSLLFTIGKYGIGLYVGKAGVASAYGAAGSIVVLLVWVYYSAQIFLLGAEFTWVYTYAMGSRAGQTPPAVAAIPSRDPRRAGGRPVA